MTMQWDGDEAREAAWSFGWMLFVAVSIGALIFCLIWFAQEKYIWNKYAEICREMHPARDGSEHLTCVRRNGRSNW